jgi:uncharacterized protein DUF4252
MRRLTIIATVTLLLTGCGITGNYRSDPGYAEFGSPGPLDTDLEFGLSLGALPLGIARFILDDDPEIGPLLRELRAVRVYTYEVNRDAEDVAQRLQAVHSELVADGWLPIVKVREDNENVSVLLQPAEHGRNGNRGIAVIVQDSSEVVLVNLIGNVRLDQFAEYMVDLEVELPHIEIDPETLPTRVEL